MPAHIAKREGAVVIGSSYEGAFPLVMVIGSSSEGFGLPSTLVRESMACCVLSLDNLL